VKKIGTVIYISLHLVLYFLHFYSTECIQMKTTILFMYRRLKKNV